MKDSHIRKPFRIRAQVYEGEGGRVAVGGFSPVKPPNHFELGQILTNRSDILLKKRAREVRSVMKYTVPCMRQF
jgi:hypothetical protein